MSRGWQFSMPMSVWLIACSTGIFAISYWKENRHSNVYWQKIRTMAIHEMYGHIFHCESQSLLHLSSCFLAAILWSRIRSFRIEWMSSSSAATASQFEQQQISGSSSLHCISTKRAGEKCEQFPHKNLGQLLFVNILFVIQIQIKYCNETWKIHRNHACPYSTWPQTAPFRYIFRQTRNKNVKKNTQTKSVTDERTNSRQRYSPRIEHNFYWQSFIHSFAWSEQVSMSNQHRT